MFSCLLLEHTLGRRPVLVILFDSVLHSARPIQQVLSIDTGNGLVGPIKAIKGHKGVALRHALLIPSNLHGYELSKHRKRVFQEFFIHQWVQVTDKQLCTHVSVG